MPEEALVSFADHGTVGPLLSPDPAPADGLLARFAAAGVEVEALGEDLQVKGTESFAKSWRSLIERIEAKVKPMAAAG